MESSFHRDLLGAIQEGNKELVKTLIESTWTDFTKCPLDNTKESFLHVAAQNGQTEIIGLLITHLDVNATVSEEDKVITPLMLAIEGNHDETVKFLLDHGAKTSIPSLLTYYQLFSSACVNQQDKIVKILLNHGIRLCSTCMELQRYHLPSKIIF